MKYTLLNRYPLTVNICWKKDRFFPGETWRQRPDGSWCHVGHFTEPTEEQVRILEEIRAKENL